MTNDHHCEGVQTGKSRERIIVPRWLFEEGAGPHADILFLSSIHIPAQVKTGKWPIKFEVMPEPWPHVREWVDTAKYLETVFVRMFGKIAEMLNTVHGVDLPAEFWKLPLTPWLSQYIHGLYDCYYRLACAKDKFKEEPLSLAAPPITLDLTQPVIGNFSPMQMAVLYREAAKVMGIPVHHYSMRTDRAMSKGAKRMVVTDYFSKAANKLSQFVRLPIPTKFWNGAASVIDIYGLSRSDKYYFATHLDARWEIDWSSVPVAKNIDRMPLRSIKSDDPFEAFLVNLLPLCMPAYLVEHFGHYFDRAKQHEHFKLYVTGTGFYANPLLAYAASRARLKGATVVGWQHGGGYGQFMYSEPEFVDRYMNDYYITWGWSDKACQGAALLPLPQPYFRAKRRPAKEKYAFWVGNTVPKNVYRFQPYPFMPDNMPAYFEAKAAFLSNLSGGILPSIMYRPYPVDLGFLEDEMKLVGKYPAVKISADGLLHEKLLGAHLFISEHRGSVFLQALEANVPSILFWDNDIDRDRPAAKEWFDLLRNAGILFHDPAAAAKQVNAIWGDVEGWWRQPERQEARRKFVDRFCRSADDWREQWVAALREIMAGKRHG